MTVEKVEPVLRVSATLIGNARTGQFPVGKALSGREIRPWLVLLTAPGTSGRSARAAPQPEPPAQAARSCGCATSLTAKSSLARGSNCEGVQGLSSPLSLAYQKHDASSGAPTSRHSPVTRSAAHSACRRGQTHRRQWYPVRIRWRHRAGPRGRRPASLRRVGCVGRVVIRSDHPEVHRPTGPGNILSRLLRPSHGRSGGIGPFCNCHQHLKIPFYCPEVGRDPAYGNQATTTRRSRTLHERFARQGWQLGPDYGRWESVRPGFSVAIQIARRSHPPATWSMFPRLSVGR
ncbi:hypothetical protein OKW41_002762 [Paraburkholderia sp. UCT70]